MQPEGDTPFQTFVAKAIDCLPKTRNFYDRQLQHRLGTTGKPLYDISRKNYRPKRETLRAIADVLEQPLSRLEAALDGAVVEPLAFPDADRQLAVLPRADTVTPLATDAGEVASIIRLDLSLPMGPGALVDDYVEEEPVVFDMGYIRALTRTPPGRLRLARGVGDSMFPTLQTNDQVWIDTTQNQLLHADRIYAATINGGAAIKRLRPINGGRRVLVISDNKVIEPYEVDADDVRIWGRVIRFVRDL